VLPCVLLLLGLFGSAARSEAMLRYALDYDAATETMHVALCADAAPGRRFMLDRGAEIFIAGLERDHGAIERAPRGLFARDWRDGECLRYLAALGRVADRADSEIGLRLGGDLVTAPTQWLLGTDHDGPAEVEIRLPAGVAFSAPWKPLRGNGTIRYRIPDMPRGWAASIALGRFAQREMALRGGRLHVALPGVRDATTQAKLFAWIDDVGRAALSGFGRLPVADVQVLVLPAGARRQAVVFGQSQRGQGHGLLLLVDVSRPADEFRDDWTAVHEFAHLFHPYLGDNGRWLAEGLASYWQNVLRARAGLLTPAQAWERLDTGFGRGRADAAGTRLDRAPHGAFMRIYWSGAAYWLDVDVELRRTSGGTKSLDLALDRFAACCLPAKREWTPREFVTKLDALIDADVFARRYDKAAAATTFPELGALYAALGIAKDGRTLRFDDAASDAAARRAIMAPHQAQKEP